MLQRNVGPQSQMGLAAPNRSEGQIGSMSAAQPSLVPGMPVERVVVGEQYLVFSLVDHEFAIQAEYIQGVERLSDVTSVPHVAPWVVGVMNLRGSICSIVDLRAFLDVERLPYNSRTRLLSVKYNEMLICLMVDSVSEMVPIAPNAIEGTMRSIPSWVASYASGMATVGKRRVILLDAARLLFADKMHHYST